MSGLGKHLLGVIGVAGTVGVATPAVHALGGALQLEEVVVTARKREERIQDTPISITAFTEDSIANLGMNGLNDIAVRTPGLQYGNFGDLKLSPLSLRGIVDSGGTAGSDPVVGVYVDEVFVGQGAGASFDLFDIDRVEVLRGPQGTLFGRNALGGVVSLTTRRPSEEVEAAAEATYGNYGKTRIGGLFSGPLIPGELAGKIALVHDEREGTYRNLALDRKVNDNKSWTLRGQLLFTPGDATSLLLTAERREVDQQQLIFETLTYNDEALLPQLLDLYGLPRNEDPFDRNVYADIVPEESLELWAVSAVLDQNVGGLDLASITSYRTHDYYSRTDTDRSPLAILYDGDPEDVWRFSQELRLSGNVGAVDWLGGVYYFKQRTTNLSFVEIGADLADLIGIPEIGGLVIGSDGAVQTESMAAFGSIAWEFASRLDLTVGARYTYEEKKINYAQTDALGLLGGDFSIDGEKEDWARLTPNVSLRYRPSDETLTYATVSFGFRSGWSGQAICDNPVKRHFSSQPLLTRTPWG